MKGEKRDDFIIRLLHAEDRYRKMFGIRLNIVERTGCNRDRLAYYAIRAVQRGSELNECEWLEIYE